MLTFVQNRENFSLFFACTGGGPIREAGRTEYAVMSREAVHCTKMGFCRSRISPRPGGPSERVWHGGTMTVTVSAGILHFPDFVLYEEAAAVVRRIFAMTVEGMGPYRIAKILSDEKVEKPSYYQAVRGRGCYKNQCDFEHPYAWMGVSIVRMLEKPEYMGDTVNFRSRKQND